MKKYAILLAGGSGSRIGGNLPKQFLKLDNGLTILENSILKFANHDGIDEIILVSNSEYLPQTTELVKEMKLEKSIKVISGGTTRQASSLAGVLEVSENEAIILIHDVARPFVSAKIITDCIDKMQVCKAASTVIGATDTVYILDNNNGVKTIPERSKVCLVQTPQVFYKTIMLEAHKLAKQENLYNFSDDLSIVKYFDLCELGIVAGSIENKKITYIEDLKLI